MSSRTRVIVMSLSAPVIAFAIVGGFLGRVMAREDTYQHLKIFDDVVSLISSNYVEEADIDKVMRGAMHGLFGFYIARIVPLLGGAVSGHYSAYRWLGQSLRPHPDADTMAAIMRAAGLAEVGYRLTGFGTVAIHYAVKPGASARSGRGEHDGRETQVEGDGHSPA